MLALDPAQVPDFDRVESSFPLRVPQSFVERMVPGDPNDPLLRQVLPVRQERFEVDGFRADPLEESEALAAPGLLHKYHGRVLMITTGACGVHCRYCFRRHFPYEQQAGRSRWEPALAYVASDPTIEEVILSGGDPLAMTDARLRDLVLAIAEIPHVRRLRVHARMPIVLPSRVGDALLEWLTETRLESVVVVHANHPQEIGQEVQKALRQIVRAGVTVLNQAVLLRGINDDAGTLASLSKRLFAAGVLPYYLSLLDKVAGAAHFEVSVEDARRLHWELIGRLPGYLIPRFVREIPSAASKVPLFLESPHDSPEDMSGI